MSRKQLSSVDGYRKQFLADYKKLHSWRKVASEYGLHPSMARMIANGYDPGKKIRWDCHRDKRLILAHAAVRHMLPSGVPRTEGSIELCGVCQRMYCGGLSKTGLKCKSSR
jgi:hypothetical protein